MSTAVHISRLWVRLASVGAVALAGAAAAQTPLGSAFTYQGELRQSGSPAAGAADFRFRLYTADVAGTQIGGEVAVNGVALSSGRFAAALDFGVGAFTGEARWLEIDVRSPAGSGLFVTLTPRQRVTPSPAARFAAEAANATQLNGQGAAFYQNASNLTGTLPGGLLSGSYAGALTFGNASNSFAGSGSGLTGLNASNVGGGTLADARLSANVAFLGGGQTFTGAKSFTGGLSTSAFTLTPGAAAGRVLTSDAGGVGTWQAPVVPSPMTLTGSDANWLVAAQNGSTDTGARAILGVMTSTLAGSSSVAVRGDNKSTSGSGIGVWGSQNGAGWGVYGQSVDGIGVYGNVSGASAVNNGVWGQSASTSGRGVVGYVSATTSGGTTFGVFGQTDAPNGYGVCGLAQSVSFGGIRYGVYGSLVSPGLLAGSYGVFSSGDFGASGTKAFRIDHPFDPLNRYLLHYSSESPEPQNFYSGVATTDAQGYAWVELPDYFEAINRDFKYQLTPINEADDQFVMAMVTRRIEGNRFRLRASKPGVEVSWRVEATRNDAFCRQYPPRTEVNKAEAEKGRYQHPELYGAPAELGVNRGLSASR